jgi:hypothetical protein
MEIIMSPYFTGDVMACLRYNHEVNISIDNYHMDTIVWSDNGCAVRVVIVKANLEHKCEEDLMTSDIFTFTNLKDLVCDLKRDIEDISKIRIFGNNQKDKDFILKVLQS